jgi:hypothetical protein
LFLCIGVVLFQVKYTVSDLENMHKALKKQILEKSEELHVLNAEWAYLNDPNRLTALANKHLKNLSPIRGEQEMQLSSLKNSGLGAYDRQELDSLVRQKASLKQRSR